MTRTLEDLYCGGLKIYQDTKLYRFTSDSVLLANYFSAPKNSNVLELCSGSGVISILGTQKTQAKNYFLFEINKDLCQMCNQSIKYNNLKNINVFNRPITDAPKILANQRIDVVVVNPPYFKPISGKEDNATHEITTNIEEIVAVTQKTLKFGGKMYLVWPAQRFAELCHVLISHNIQPKKATFVSPNNKPFSVCLVTAEHGGKPGIKIDTIVT